MVIGIALDVGPLLGAPRVVCDPLTAEHAVIAIVSIAKACRTMVLFFTPHSFAG
jgi:hypothetical protein